MILLHTQDDTAFWSVDREDIETGVRGYIMKILILRIRRKRDGKGINIQIEVKRIRRIEDVKFVKFLESVYR